jgi:tetratricopeptide (TPR) repeat protein
LQVLNASPILRGDDSRARNLSGLIHLRKADYRTAIPELGANVDSKLVVSDDVAYLAYGYALAGRKEEAVANLRELQRLRKHEYIEPGWIAMVWVGLGDKDKALDLLQDDYRLHSSFLMSLASNPVFEPLHSDSRFQDLLRRVGLPSN